MSRWHPLIVGVVHLWSWYLALKGWINAAARFAVWCNEVKGAVIYYVSCCLTEPLPSWVSCLDTGSWEGFTFQGGLYMMCTTRTCHCHQTNFVDPPTQHLTPHYPPIPLFPPGMSYATVPLNVGLGGHLGMCIMCTTLSCHGHETNWSILLFS